MHQGRPVEPLFTLDRDVGGPIRRTLFTVIKRPLAKVLQLDRLNEIYAEAMTRSIGGRASLFVGNVLDTFGVDYDISDEDLKRIPREGPVLVAANHPFGAIEGLMIGHILSEVRPDVKIMANYLLNQIPEMRPILINVDPFDRRDSKSRNISGLKESMAWLKKGSMLGVFPAGEVASLKLKKRMITDARWSPTIAGLARKTKATVLPLFFSGRNGTLFHLMGLIHPHLRTMLLPYANLKHSETTVKVAVGTPIPHKKLAAFKSDEDRIDYIRFRTFVLKTRTEKSSQKNKVLKTGIPTAPPQDRNDLLNEIQALAPKNTLAKHGQLMVLEAEAQQIPCLLEEIGRAREETFRAAGEGTGQPSDLDRYDRYYHHLILWNSQKNEVAGGYRIGLTDKIIAEHGPPGLYTTSLFKIRPEMLDRIQPALEVGRSFVMPDYQKDYLPLVLLWKAIAAFVVKHRKYRTLFGCVSVSNDYSGLSRELIVRFLNKHCRLPAFEDMVRPTSPPKLKQINRFDMAVPDLVFNDPSDMGPLIGDIEADKGIPPLLKHYLKLGGKLLAFNVDKDFGFCIDGLILVDLLHTDPKILGRFMGKKEAKTFLEAQRKTAGKTGAQ